MASAVLIPCRNAEDLYAGWWQLIQGLGAAPRLLVWDSEGAVGRHPDRLTAECQGFRGTLATRVYVCKPADPEAKGLVERFHDYLERSFLPGREFTSPADLDAQLSAWIAKANTRWHRRLECRPADRIGADRAGMIALPPVSSFWMAKLTVDSEHIRSECSIYRRSSADSSLRSSKSVISWGRVSWPSRAPRAYVPARHTMARAAGLCLTGLTAMAR